MLNLPELIKVESVSSLELEFLVLPKLKSVISGFNNCLKLKRLDLRELSYVLCGFDGCTNLEILNLPKLEKSYGFQNCPKIKWNHMNETSND